MVDMYNQKYRLGWNFYDGEMKYYIERINEKGKWKFLFGGLTGEKANWYMANHDAIEVEYQRLKVYGYITLVVGLVCTAFWIFK